MRLPIIDRELTVATHVQKLSSRCFYQLRRLRTIRHSLSEEAVKTLVHVLLVTRLDYTAIVYCPASHKSCQINSSQS